MTIQERPRHLAPNFLSRVNEGIIKRSNQFEIEYQCNERIKLCELLQTADPNNPTWKYAKEFFETFPQGKEAIWDLSIRWGIFEKKKNGSSHSEKELKAPPGMDEVYPREFLDLDTDTVKKLDPNQNPNLSRLAEEARRASLAQYDELKSHLLKAGKIPLLCGDYIRTLIKMDPKAPSCIIGLSADEAQAYSVLSRRDSNGNPPPLLGINKGYSPTIEKMIENGKIEEIHNYNQKINSQELEPGKIYITKIDITQSLPIEKDQFKIGALYVFHHFPKKEQGELTNTLLDHAKELPGGGLGVAFFEPLSSQELYMMVLDTNWFLRQPTSAFDALIGTTACGGQTVPSFLEKMKSYTPEQQWYGKLYPNTPPLPFFAPFFERKILPQQQVGLTACEV